VLNPAIGPLGIRRDVESSIGRCAADLHWHDRRVAEISTLRRFVEWWVREA
jgi:hypothetical protein